MEEWGEDWRPIYIASGKEEEGTSGIPYSHTPQDRWRDRGGAIEVGRQTCEAARMNRTRDRMNANGRTTVDCSGRSNGRLLIGMRCFISLPLAEGLAVIAVAFISGAITSLG